MTPNQKTGIMLTIFALIMWSAPPLIIGVPVPFTIYFPLAIIGMLAFIVGFCCVLKVFDD